MEYRDLVIAGPMDLIVLLLYIYCTYGSGMWVGVLWKHSLQHEGQLLLLEVARHGSHSTHEKSENKSKIIASTTTTKFISLCAVTCHF